MTENESVFDKMLKEFCDSTDEFQSVALISTDGLPISSYSETDTDMDSVTATVASFHNLTETGIKEFKNEPSREMIITSSGGIIIMVNLKEFDVVFYVYALSTPKLGYLMYQIREFITTLTPLL